MSYYLPYMVAYGPSLYAYITYIHPYIPYARICGYITKKYTEKNEQLESSDLERYDIVGVEKGGLYTTIYYLEKDYTIVYPNKIEENQPVWL